MILLGFYCQKNKMKKKLKLSINHIVFQEEDVFVSIVPLDDTAIFDSGVDGLIIDTVRE